MDNEPRKQSENKLVRVGVIGVVLLLVGFVVYMLWPDAGKIKVTINSRDFHAQVADTDELRDIGLTNVEKMAENQALLMAYDTDSTWSVYTKGLKFPIDIIWVDKDHKVAFVARNAQPSEKNMFRPGSKVRYVLQLPAGTISKYNISIGTQVDFDYHKGQ